MINGYYQEILKLPILSEEELINNFKLLESGDKNAKEVLIKHNIRLVIYLINKYFSNVKHDLSMDDDDLIDIGTIGLMKAIDTFDYRKEKKFTTYASCVIKNEILMQIRRTKNIKYNISLDKSLASDNDESCNLWTFLDSGIDIEQDYIDEERKQIIRKS